MLDQLLLQNLANLLTDVVDAGPQQNMTCHRQ